MTSIYKSKVIALVAAFNEESTIGSIVTRTLPYVDEVIVIDDCSSDATYIRAEEAGALTLHQMVNRGYDAALQKGFECALARNAGVIVTLDGDGQHNPEDIVSIIQPIIDDHADIVIGQRANLTHWCEKLFARYTGRYYNITDPLCGFKAYGINVCKKIGHFDTLGSIGTQLMLEAVACGFRMMLVPMQINSRADVSRFYLHKIRGNYKICKAMMRIIFNVPRLKK